MRIVSIGEPSSCRYYRSLIPIEGLASLGHTTAYRNHPVPYSARATNSPAEIAGFDVILGYRKLFANERLVRQGIADGAAFVWDTDDDLATLPRESRTFKGSGGRQGIQSWVTQCIRLARLADLVTTTTPRIAAIYKRAGVKQVMVIDNHLMASAFRRVPDRGSRRDVTIGWVAGEEHRVDLKRVPFVRALRRLLAEHPNVKVESVGVELPLPGDRYRHWPSITLPEIPDLLARWDVGIAPLTDIPFNRARSDVKLKEYGACGLAWLASPVGPYADKSEQEGGRLVPDHAWHEHLDALVRDPSVRAQLGGRAIAWAQSQLIDVHARQWETACAHALSNRDRRVDGGATRRAAGARR